MQLRDVSDVKQIWGFYFGEMKKVNYPNVYLSSKKSCILIYWQMKTPIVSRNLNANELILIHIRLSRRKHYDCLFLFVWNKRRINIVFFQKRKILLSWIEEIVFKVLSKISYY